MSGRRRHRIAMLATEDVLAIEGDARKLLDTMRRALMKLVPFNESYSALHRLGDEMHIALNIISGRPADHTEPLVGPGAMPPDPDRKEASR
jgi:hypothetical protein